MSFTQHSRYREKRRTFPLLPLGVVKPGEPRPQALRNSSGFIRRPRVWTWDLAGNRLTTYRWYGATGNEARVIFDLSKSADFDQLLSWLTDFFGTDTENLFNCRIVRLDMCVDLGLDADYLARIIHVPRAQSWQSGGRGGSSYYIGKPPRQTYIYSIRDRPLDWIPKISEFPLSGIGTRIEVRLFGRYLPIKQLYDLGELVNTKPFEHLRFKAPEKSMIAGLPNAKRYRLEAFLSRVKEVGFHGARQEYNRENSGNFSRDINPYLIEAVIPDLNALSAARVSRFLSFTDSSAIGLPEVSP